MPCGRNPSRRPEITGYGIGSYRRVSTYCSLGPRARAIPVSCASLGRRRQPAAPIAVAGAAAPGGDRSGGPATAWIGSTSFRASRRPLTANEDGH
jgi:hypothetical protein